MGILETLTNTGKSLAETVIGGGQARQVADRREEGELADLLLGQVADAIRALDPDNRNVLADALKGWANRDNTADPAGSSAFDDLLRNPAVRMVAAQVMRRVAMQFLGRH